MRFRHRHFPCARVFIVTVIIVIVVNPNHSCIYIWHVGFPLSYLHSYVNWNLLNFFDVVILPFRIQPPLNKGVRVL